MTKLIVTVNNGGDSKIIEVDCELDLPVFELKKRIYKENQIPVDHQFISHNNVIVDNNSVLSELGISRESSLNLAVIIPFPVNCHQCHRSFSKIYPICLPSNLQCGHAVCIACVNTCVEQEAEEHACREENCEEELRNNELKLTAALKYSCPVCTQPSWFCERKNATEHQSMNALMNWFFDREKNEDRPTCFVGGCGILAVTYCAPCGHSYCAEHDEKLHQILSDHVRQPVVPRPACTVHPEQKCEYYCGEHNVFTCKLCIVEGGAHQGHRMESITVAAAQVRSNAEEIKQKLAGLYDEAYPYSSGFNEKMESLETVYSQHAVLIRESFARARQLLNEKEIALMHQLDEEKLAKEQYCIQNCNFLGRLLAECSTGQESIELMTSTLRDVEIVQQRALLEDERVEVEAAGDSLRVLASATEEIIVPPCFSLTNMTDLIAEIEAISYILEMPVPRPTELTVTPGVNSLHISWTAVELEDCDYIVEVAAPSTGFQSIYKGRETNCVYAKLEPTTEFTVRVCVEKNGRTGEWLTSVQPINSPEFFSNLFEPMVLDLNHKSAGLVMSPTNPMQIKSSGSNTPCTYQTILGSVGIEITPRSGKWGYFEVIVHSQAKFSNQVGFSTQDNEFIDHLGRNLSNSSTSIGLWYSNISPSSISCTLPGLKVGKVNSEIKFTSDVENTIGVLLNCQGEPYLAWFANKKEVYRTILPPSCYNLVLFPAFCVFYPLHNDMTVCTSAQLF